MLVLSESPVITFNRRGEISLPYVVLLTFSPDVFKVLHFKHVGTKVEMTNRSSDRDEKYPSFFCLMHTC
jgi:hypothetical protein